MDYIYNIGVDFIIVNCFQYGVYDLIIECKCVYY